MANQVIGVARSYHRKALFVVEIEGFPGSKAAFQKMSPLKQMHKKTEHWEGAARTPFKGPSGRMEFPNCTLDRGQTGNRDIHTWSLQVADAVAQAGLVDQDYKRNMSIVQLDLAGEEAQRWNLFGAWPEEYQAGEWDNGSDDVVIEQMVLCYDYFVVV